MKKTRQTSSMKSKNTAAINFLEDKLFSKLQKLSDNGPLNKYEDLDIKLLNNTPDALTDLIYRAKGLVNNHYNKDRIKSIKNINSKEILTQK